MKLLAAQKLAKTLFSAKIKKAATRDGYGEALLELGEKNEKVVVLSADLMESTRTTAFAESYPERFVEVGVAEQNMAGVAAGMSFAGYIPFMSSFAVFSPGRNWDQVRVSICYSKANVKIAGGHAGISVGADGATHQAMEDIAIARVLPNMTVVVPSDAVETKKATLALADMRTPAYLRFGRPEAPVFTTHKSPFEIGKANVLTRGSDVTIIACGIMVYTALEAARELAKKHKISAEVINCHTIKPLDEKTILASAAKTGCVVTAEEHQIHGGMGSAIAEALSENYPVAMRFVGMPDAFGESGGAEELLEKYGMTREKIIKNALDVIKEK